MRMLKKINNNYAVAKDSTGKTVIVSGSGIGFGSFPSELNDLSKIERTYYNIDDRFVRLIEKLPSDVIECSEKIVNYAESKLGLKLNPNLVFSLADHINFSIERIKQGITFDHGLTYEMNYLHPVEFEIAKEAVNMIQKKYEIVFSKEEAAIIALHILESESHYKKETINTSQVVDDLAEIVRKEMDIVIDADDFNYYRFATHIQYLMNRQKENQSIKSENKEMFNMIRNSYPKVYDCVLKMKKYFNEQLNWDVSEEEQLYLMIHINRICSKEDCYQ